MPAGPYKLTYAASLGSVVRDEIVVKIGFNDTINVTMSVASQQQTVVVTGETPAPSHLP